MYIHNMYKQYVQPCSFSLCRVPLQAVSVQWKAAMATLPSNCMHEAPSRTANMSYYERYTRPHPFCSTIRAALIAGLHGQMIAAGTQFMHNVWTAGYHCSVVTHYSKEQCPSMVPCPLHGLLKRTSCKQLGFWEITNPKGVGGVEAPPSTSQVALQECSCVAGSSYYTGDSSSVNQCYLFCGFSRNFLYENVVLVRYCP